MNYAARRWVEHVVIGDPFGAIGMDASGHVEWLQLETRDGLKALAELAELEGVAPADLEDIRQGRKLADLELRQSIGRSEEPQLAPAFPIGEGAALLGALFTVESPLCPDRSNSYSHWLARQEKRHVRN
jgi:hypothetical protein